MAESCEREQLLSFCNANSAALAAADAHKVGSTVSGLALCSALKALTLSTSVQMNSLFASFGIAAKHAAILAAVVTAGVVATGVVTASVVAAGVVAAGVVAAGVVAAGVVAAGVVAPGVVAAGVVAPGVVAAGVVAPGVVAAGVVAAGVVFTTGSVTGAGVAFATQL